MTDPQQRTKTEIKSKLVSYKLAESKFYIEISKDKFSGIWFWGGETTIQSNFK